MSRVRYLVPGDVHVVRRACTQRLGLLGASPELNRILEYCLAFAARAAHLRVHAFCFFPTHYTIVVTDPEARLPEFTETFHSLVARALNKHHKRREFFWAPGRPEHSLVAERSDVLGACAEVLSEPVRARLVRSLGAWPCASTLRVSTKVLERPECFEDGELPREVPLGVESPEAGEKSESWAARVRREVVANIGQLRRWWSQIAAPTTKVLGAAAVRAMKPEDWAMVAPPRKWGTVWAVDEGLIEEVLKALEGFWALYADAVEAMRNHVVAVFPVGTYGYRRRLRFSEGEGLIVHTFRLQSQEIEAPPPRTPTAEAS